jgi:hypothetical protein
MRNQKLKLLSEVIIYMNPNMVYAYDNISDFVFGNFWFFKV